MGSQEEQPEPGRVPEKAMQLIEWMATKGVWWNSNLMQFRDSRESGIGLWAQQPVSDGDRLCQLPKAALLSVRNASIADVLEAEELSGGLGLSFAVMFERALPESPWRGYLDFLPAREYLPMFWPEVLLQLLHGTSLPVERVAADAAAMQEDFAQVQEAMHKHPERFEGVRGAMTFSAFQTAAAWVSSRAFYVDSYHGMCMVPLADAFNHKAAVVSFSSDYTVAETDDAEKLLPPSARRDTTAATGDLEDQAGGSQQPQSVATGAAAGAATVAAARASDAAGMQAKQPRIEGSSCVGAAAGDVPVVVEAGGYNEGGVEREVELPRVSGVATGAAATRCEVPAEQRLEIAIIDAEEHEEAGEDGDGSGGGGALVIVAASDVPVGSEIHNTYGEYGNAELLYKHGFALQRNPFNALSVSMAELGAAAADVLGEHAAHARMQWLRSTLVDCSEDDEDDGGSADEDADGDADGGGDVMEASNIENRRLRDGGAGVGSPADADVDSPAQNRKRPRAHAEQLLPEAEQGKVTLESASDQDVDAGESEGEGVGGRGGGLEERVDGSSLQIFDSGRATVAILCVLWCMGETLDLSASSGASVRGQEARPSGSAAVLRKFAAWLESTLRAVGAAGGAAAADAQSVLERMEGDGDGDEGDDEFLERKVPLEVVVGALDGAAVQVLAGVVHARLGALQSCVLRVDAAAAAVAEAVRGGAADGEGLTRVADAVERAAQVPEGESGCGGCTVGSSEASGGEACACTLREVQQAVSGVGRLAKWELAAVRHVLEVCGAAQAPR